MAINRFHPDVVCPQCGSSEVARSQRTNGLERFISHWRFWPLRCMDCQRRWFVYSAHDPKEILKAKLKRKRS